MVNGALDRPRLLHQKLFVRLHMVHIQGQHALDQTADPVIGPHGAHRKLLIAAQDGQMDHNIDRLRYAALELLIRLSKRFPRKRASTIFLVNNLHHIVQVASHHLQSRRAGTIHLSSCIAGRSRGLATSMAMLAQEVHVLRALVNRMEHPFRSATHGTLLVAGTTVTPVLVKDLHGLRQLWECRCWPDSQACVQLLREAASRGGQMAHAPGTSPPPPTAPLGASGAETIKEFEVHITDLMLLSETPGFRAYPVPRPPGSTPAGSTMQRVAQQSGYLIPASVMMWRCCCI